VPETLVSIGLVTWNSAAYLPGCLSALGRLQDNSHELIVVDNASSDDSLALVRQYCPEARILRNETNTGFSYAHNQAIKVCKGRYYLALNPDVLLSPDFLMVLTRTLELDDRVGQATGKLYRVSSAAEVGKSKVIDSAGLFFTPNQRHFDRGAGETDTGQYDQTEYVFGVSGAAAFYRKSALEDSAVDGEYFDTSFFAYREDADLSWRMQLLGWKALYVPEARAYHFRMLRNDARRSDVAKAVNLHSVKNRFLMRIKNQTWRNGLRFCLPIVWRDLMVIGYVLLFERSSLPAFSLVFKLYPRARRWRREIMSKRTVSDGYIGGWFGRKALPFEAGAQA
jgi:GT2 family glycosyltransferase